MDNTLECCNQPCKGWIVSDAKLHAIERIVDKIRYAMTPEVEKKYIEELLTMFSPDSSRFTAAYNITKNSS